MKKFGIWPALLSGVLVGTSYIPFPPWAIAFAYVPLFVFWMRTESIKAAFISGWVAQFILTLIGFHWVSHVAVEFGHFPPFLGALVLIGFASLIHLHIPIMGALFVFLRQILKRPEKMRRAQWLLPMVAIAVETSYPQIFPWNLGYTLLWAKVPVYQFADLIGFEGLSAFIFLLNALIAWLWIHRAPPGVSFSRRWKILATSVVIGVPLLIFLGAAHGEQQREDYVGPAAPRLKALLVQANIGNFEKFWAERRADYRTPIIERYERLTRQGMTLNDPVNPTPVDVVLWPETAFPDALDPNFLSQAHQQRFLNLVKATKTSYLIGAYSDDPIHRFEYNSIFHFDPEGNSQSLYRKRKLLAFGEYFPFADTFPILKKWIPEISDFDFGRDFTPPILKVGHEMVPVALQICYEGLFPRLTDDFILQGADIIVNATNDSWYGTKFEPFQHMTMTLARAIEFRRPLLRVTNTGISTVMLASGEQLESSPLESEWTHLYDVPFRPHAPLTLYARLSPFMPALFWVVLLLSWGWIYLRTKRVRNTSI